MKWTLHELTGFPDHELEAAFWRHDNERRKASIRAVMVVLPCAVAAFAVVDYVGIPQVWRTTVAMRAVIVVLLAAGLRPLFGRGGDAFLVQHAQALLIYLGVVTVAGLLAIWWFVAPVATEDIRFIASGGLMFASSSLYCVSGMRFRNVLLVGTLGGVSYFVISRIAGHASIHYLLGTAVYAFGVMVSGLGINWTIEHHHRRQFLRERELQAERQRADAMLLNLMPAHLAARLKQTHGAVLDRLPEATVLFATLTGFDQLTRSISPVEAVSRLDELVGEFDQLALEHGVERVKTIGATYMAAAGISGELPDHADRVARLALAMRDRVRAISAERQLALQLRIGICSGTVVAGVIGRTRFAFDCWGDTTNTAARLDTHGAPDRIHIGAGTVERLGTRFALEPRGTVAIKGKGLIDTWWLEANA